MKRKIIINERQALAIFEGANLATGATENDAIRNATNLDNTNSQTNITVPSKATGTTANTGATYQVTNKKELENNSEVQKTLANGGTVVLPAGSENTSISESFTKKDLKRFRTNMIKQEGVTISKSSLIETILKCNGK